MFGKLGDVNYLNNNILSFNGFAFTEDSPEYAKKLVLLGKYVFRLSSLQVCKIQFLSTSNILFF